MCGFWLTWSRFPDTDVPASQDELEDSLYAFVDKDKMRGYNVMQGEDQVAQVCKSWDQRRDTSLVSDSGEPFPLCRCVSRKLL